MESILALLLILLIAGKIAIGQTDDEAVRRAIKLLGLRAVPRASGELVGEGKYGGRDATVHLTDGKALEERRFVQVSLEAPGVPEDLMLQLRRESDRIGRSEGREWLAILTVHGHNITGGIETFGAAFPRAFADFIAAEGVDAVAVDRSKVTIHGGVKRKLTNLTSDGARLLVACCEQYLQLALKLDWTHASPQALWLAVFRHELPGTRARADALRALLSEHAESPSAADAMSIALDGPNVFDLNTLVELHGPGVLDQAGRTGIGEALQAAVRDGETALAQTALLLEYAQVTDAVTSAAVKWPTRVAVIQKAMQRRVESAPALLRALLVHADPNTALTLLEAIAATDYVPALEALGHLDVAEHSVGLDRSFAATAFGLTEVAAEGEGDAALETWLIDIIERGDPVAATDAIAALKRCGTSYSVPALERVARKRVDLYGLAALSKDAVTMIQARAAASPHTGGVSLIDEEADVGGLSVVDDDGTTRLE